VAYCCCSDQPMYKKEQQLQASIAASAVLSYLGWLSSGPAATTAVSAPMAKGRRVKSSGGTGSSSVSGTAPAARADLRVKPPSNTNVPNSVPRSVSNQVVWDVVKIDGTQVNSTSAPTEFNFNASLSAHPQASSWQALFDQWTVPQFSVSYQAMTPPGLTTAPPRLYTALDFDNTNTIGTITAIEDYSTSSCLELQPQSKIVRSIKPCTKPVNIGTTSGVARMWIDSGTPSAVFYGIRSMMSASGAQVTVSTTLTIWFAFRNQI